MLKAKECFCVAYIFLCLNLGSVWLWISIAAPGIERLEPDVLFTSCRLTFSMDGKDGMCPPQWWRITHLSLTVNMEVAMIRKYKKFLGILMMVFELKKIANLKKII